ncbi:hypothetical protein C8Q76DRAFT_467588 [Earliella scabrosa]|nr:hypothetical protein C8Q76DRAFT_467588 [Earliella scabrosa]
MSKYISRRSHTSQETSSYPPATMSIPTASDTQSTTDSPCQWVRDQVFFVDVKPLFIRVENVSFCVPRHRFDASEVFQDMFTLPTPPDRPGEGSVEENPLFLEGVKVDQFRDFLRVLCYDISSLPRSINSNTLFICLQQIPTSWMNVLELAARWQFEEIRQHALNYLSMADGMTRLIAARKFQLTEWLIPALQNVGLRDAALTVEEIQELGLDFAVKVIALRERMRPRHGGYNVSKPDITAIFGETLAA